MSSRGTPARARRPTSPPAFPSRPSSPRTPTAPHTPPHTTYQSFADLATPPPLSPALRGEGRRGSPAGQVGEGDEQLEGGGKHGKDGEMSQWEQVKLTVGIAGAQLAWTVEMAYGTPYLLGLGLSKQGTSLVWMAGPLSGLIVQPVVGALSDSSPSPYRRRQYILLSTALILLSTLVVAFARELAALLCSLPLLGGLGDWDPGNAEREKSVAIGLGIVGFYGLDFALNGLQASLRALTLDVSPPSTLSSTNAWLARHTHLANILGYLLGFTDLGHSPLLHFLGGGQFRKLAVLACLVMVACVAVTCVSGKEEAREEPEENEGAWMRLKGVVSEVADNVRTLPKSVRRVCYVQFFAWTAWFPFLFYSTTYVAETLYSSLPAPSTVPSSPRTPRPPSADEATRLGSLALLYYALVSLAAGILLPWLCSVGRTYPSLPRRVGPVGRVVLSKVTERNCWTAGLAMYAVAMAATFFVTGVKGAMAIVAVAGVPWAVTCWVPFALVMESIRELAPPASSSPTSPDPTSPASLDLFFSPPKPRHPTATGSLEYRTRTPFRANPNSLRQASFTVPHAQREHYSSAPSSVAGSPARGPAVDERTPLVEAARERWKPVTSANGEAGEGARARNRVSGGTLLGIHNLAIVLPQFFVAVIAALIFTLTARRAPSDSDSFAPTLSALSSLSSLSDEPVLQQQNADVVWVLRFGGLASAVGAVVSRWVVETGGERDYRWWVLRGWREAEAEREQAEGE
ncbi:hypothetical protein JCM10213_005425 [Rhodosporidiobolus nylandii]